MEMLPWLIFFGLLFNSLIFWKVKIHRALLFIPIIQQAYIFITSLSVKDLPMEWTLLSSQIPGFSISFYIDGLSVLFLSLISGIGILVHLYAWAYFKKDSEFYKCISLLQYFWIAMVGMVTSANLLLLFVFWELTTISSYFLIGFKNEKLEVRKSALQALFVTGGGGLFLLAGLLFLYKDFGTWELSEIVNLVNSQHSAPYLSLSAFLILIGCITKSAQFPFHFWLPGAMAAPTPISSYLHSATMVKAGLFLMLRTFPIFQNVPYWLSTITILGAITAALGAIIAFTKTDLKQILAYTTVSALGIIATFIGLGTSESFHAAALFIVVHALYKAGLFMIAGSIDKLYGTRDIRKLGGALKSHPYLSLPFVILILSMLGIPPFIGFISKEINYEVYLKSLFLPELLTTLSYVTNIFVTAIGAKLIFCLLFQNSNISSEKKVSLALSPLILSLFTFIFGVYSQPLSQTLLTPFVTHISESFFDSQLSLWHGINLPLILSLATLIVGFSIFKLRNILEPLTEKLFSFHEFPEKAFQWNLSFFEKCCKWLVQVFFLKDYRTSLAFFMAGVLFYLSLAVLNYFDFTSLKNLSWDSYYIIPLLVMLGFTSILTLFFESRTGAVLISGIVGAMVSALFAILSAPDLALTQILVETFILILFVFIVSRLPIVEQRKHKALSPFALTLSVGLSLTISLILASVLLDENSGASISSYFMENSLSLANGANVVNVILVDFRSFDTLGEITVLAIAVIGVLNLIQKRRTKNAN